MSPVFLIKKTFAPTSHLFLMPSTLQRYEMIVIAMKAELIPNFSSSSLRDFRTVTTISGVQTMGLWTRG